MPPSVNPSDGFTCVPNHIYRFLLTLRSFRICDGRNASSTSHKGYKYKGCMDAGAHETKVLHVLHRSRISKSAFLHKLRSRRVAQMLGSCTTGACLLFLDHGLLEPETRAADDRLSVPPTRR